MPQTRPDSAPDPLALPDTADTAETTDDSLFDRPDSPCIGICSTLFDEVCQGCGRTAMEVSNWVFMSDAEKQAVWERITREATARRFQRD
ncbi:DUF1289 domain-containing protein [Cupriavidus sp. H18C1]